VRVLRLQRHGYYPLLSRILWRNPTGATVVVGFCIPEEGLTDLLVWFFPLHPYFLAVVHIRSAWQCEQEGRCYLGFVLIAIHLAHDAVLVVVTQDGGVNKVRVHFLVRVDDAGMV